MTDDRGQMDEIDKQNFFSALYTARHSRCEVCDLTCAYGDGYISILDIYPSHRKMRWVYHV